MLGFLFLVVLELAVVILTLWICVLRSEIKKIKETLYFVRTQRNEAWVQLTNIKTILKETK